MSLRERVDALATRVAAEINALRAEMPTGGGGGAADLDDLTDVTTTGLGDGYILTYDLASGQWVPRPGGGAVGSWENDQLVTFTGGPIGEQLNLDIPFAGNNYGNQFSLPITEALLAVSADKPVGFIPHLQIATLFDTAGMTGGTTGQIGVEVVIGASTWTFSVSVNTTSTSKSGLTVIIKDPIPGETVLVRYRFTTAALGGGVIKHRGWGTVHSNPFRTMPPGGGVYLYRDFLTGSSLPAPLVQTLGIGLAQGNWQHYDRDIRGGATTNPPEDGQPYWIAGPEYGIHGSAILNSTTRVTATNTSGTAWTVPTFRSPATVRYDRLAIPTLPA